MRKTNPPGPFADAVCPQVGQRHRQFVALSMSPMIVPMQVLFGILGSPFRALPANSTGGMAISGMSS